MLHDGDILKSRYKVTQLIGKGGMSSVYMATDLKLNNKLWAIKEVSRSARDQVGRPIEQSLATEAELLSRLDHPTIVDIVDILTTEKYIYVVMDYVEGKSLDKVIREEGPQSEEDVQNWIIQICDALDYLHNQNPPIIYRDMKPGNIMLRPDGYIKLIDLGVAREYKDSSKKDTIAFGTEGYAPPEQYGRGQTDARSDIYALGATMWHLLSGEAPCETPLPDVRSRNKDVGEGFAQVIIPKCTRLDREMRYQNCDELVADLEVYQELTQDYYNQQKAKVNAFTRTLIAGIACILAGFIFIMVGNIVVTQNYQSQIALADSLSKSSPEESIQHYQEAIDYKPDDSKAYSGLLDVYLNKDKRSTNDECTLSHSSYNEYKDVLEKHAKELLSSSAVDEVYYNFAKAIWDYYDDGSYTTNKLNRTSAMDLSTAYFKVVSEHGKNEDLKRYANRYLKIAEYTSSNGLSNSDDNDGTNKSSVETKEYLSCLEDLCKDVSGVEVSKKVKLNAYAVIQGGLYDKAEDFPKAGIPKTRLDNLCKDVKSGLNSLSFDSSEYNEIVRECSSSLDSAIRRLDLAYNNNASVGNK